MPVEDFGDRFELLQRDLVGGLSHAFEVSEDSVRVVDANFRDEEAGSVGMAWECHTVNRGSFQGMKPTDRSVVIRGFTVMQVNSDNRLEFRRYIDWSEVAAQLGMVTSFKPVRAEPPEFPAPSPPSP
jgi:hypothetical protein